MKNYFISDLAPEQLAKLQEATVPSVQFTANEKQGILIEETHLPLLLTTLKLRVMEEQETSFEGILSIKLIPQDQTIVTVNRVAQYRCAHWEQIVPCITSMLTSTLLRPTIVLHYLSGPYSHDAPLDKNSFHIFLNTIVPGGSENDGEISISYSGNMIGFPFAPSCPDDSFVKQVQDTMTRLVPILSGPPEAFSQFMVTLRDKRMSKLKDTYVKLCTIRHERNLSSTRQQIREGEQTVRELQQDTVRRMREVAGSRSKLQQLEAIGPKIREQQIGELDKLLSLPKVKSIEVDNQALHVFTDVLYCTDPRTKRVHEIGQFRITIYTNGDQNMVRWLNLTRKVTGCKRNMNAPHVNEDGTACMGNVYETFVELIAAYEFAAVTLVSIQFIESVNVHDDGGHYIDRWPEAKVEQAAIAA